MAEPAACQASLAPALPPAQHPAVQAVSTAPVPKPRHRWPTSAEEYIQLIYARHMEDGAWIRECQDIQDAYDAAARLVQASHLPKHLWAEHGAWVTPYMLTRKLRNARHRAQMSFWDRACDDADAFCSDFTFLSMFVVASPFLLCAVALEWCWSNAMSTMSASTPEPLASPNPGTTAGSDGANNSPTRTTDSCTGGSEDGTETSSACNSDDGRGTAAPALPQADGSVAGGPVGSSDQGLRMRLNAGVHGV